VTSPSGQGGPHEGPDRRGTWRDQPRALTCAVVAAFLVLTTVAFCVALLAVIMAVR